MKDMVKKLPLKASRIAMFLFMITMIYFSVAQLRENVAACRTILCIDDFDCGNGCFCDQLSGRCEIIVPPPSGTR